MKLFLGIDTSAYTSSISVVDQDFNVIFDKRLPLKVEDGKRGLRQSQALFLHLQNLPLLFRELSSFSPNDICAAAVSAFPCRKPGSYMPVFSAGNTVAQVLSAYNNLMLYQVSHQEGHIMAGILDNRKLLASKEFLAVHFSGGTSDIMLVKRCKSHFLSITPLMSSSDLYPGQLVDRIGVAMGLPFPAGKEMEKLAITVDPKAVPVIPSAVKKDSFSFSGLETRARQLMQKGMAHNSIAFSIFRSIANTLEKSLAKQAEEWGIKDILLVGGVMANSLIRSRLVHRLEHPAVGLKLHFASPRLSTDNAVGVAMMAACLYQLE
ncbi:MAG: peptidase M22 [Syntrophomonadaceae bacterium]|jgi:N6-L-threonylcarbamoyladenine synthase